jgi:S1-C subfamily serine protease
MISSVVPGSGADRAGLLPVRRTLAGVAAGDVVAAVGGRATPDAGAFAAALEQISSSGSGSSSESLEVEFDVVRGVGTGQQRREKVAVSLAPE